MSDTYCFALTGFGWFNCDKTKTDPWPRVNLTVNFGNGANANKYVSLLVFTRYRSVLLGHNDGGHKVHYQHLPPDEPVLLVTVTVNDNEQVISNIQSLTTSNNVVNNFAFEPTTPEQFKQKLQSLLASQKQ